MMEHMFYHAQLLNYKKLLFQVFISGGEHQFDSVQLVNFACTRVVIDGNNI